MESSEDDAGTATSASRRASAREKDIEQVEEGKATSSTLQEPTEARISCDTPAMSEENFDGDSVPSPSAQDVNTSTEAILDMIDEFVDGPGAPKRIPQDSSEDNHEGEPEKTDERNIAQASSQNISEKDIPPPTFASQATSAKSENEPHMGYPICTPQITQSDNLAFVSNECVEPSQECSSESVFESNDNIVSENHLQPSVQTLASEECPPNNIPSSSVLETVDNIPNVSESESLERTVKCVTSSDTLNDVTIESAESTSSDISLGEEKVLSSEQSTRSPLRRRLVRPGPSDRKPDSTVSSTVDIHTEQKSSDSLAKDVSSSSDAVPLGHGNVKPEGIRNVSEISICKAETSINPPKKIKLIRQKPLSPLISKDNSQDKQTILSEQDQCQSTSNEASTVNDTSNISSITSSKVEEKIDLNDDSAKESCSNISTLKAETSSGAPSNAILELKQENSIETTTNAENTIQIEQERKVSPIKIDLSSTKQIEPIVIETELLQESSSRKSDQCVRDECLSPKSVPKLTIKIGNKPSEEMKSPVPKITIKPIKPPIEDSTPEKEQIPNVTKLNIKPILKPEEKINDKSVEHSSDNKTVSSDQIPCVTKINIKPIPKPPEKINDIHRKSSSSEISESEYSENDDSTSTSDHATSDVVPKVTIKLGKPGTQSEGKFYTEQQNIPKLTIKGLQNSEKDESESKLKLIITQPEEKHSEKVPKLTIKTVTKCESQPLSPKLTIKPLKPPEGSSKDNYYTDNSESPQIPKLKISTECFATSTENRDVHVPKITIKPVTKTDVDSKNKKIGAICDGPEHIPLVTKVNIKPIVKPTDSGETSEVLEEKVPVVSKLNIKPIVKPKDSDLESSIEDVPKITKLNIKPLKNPETDPSEKVCDDLNADIEDNSIPIVSKINIRPIVKPPEEDTLKDSENQSSETGNSSDDNTDNIPVVTKLNIKPIVKPEELEESSKKITIDEEPFKETTPTVTKLTIKPLIKPDESKSPASPKKEILKSNDGRSTPIPVVTKLNIKPVIKPIEIETIKSNDIDEPSMKNPPLVMKINMKAVAETSQEPLINTENIINSIDDHNDHIHNNIGDDIPKTKLNIKHLVKQANKLPEDNIATDKHNCTNKYENTVEPVPAVDKIQESSVLYNKEIKQNCASEIVDNKLENIPTSSRENELQENQFTTTVSIRSNLETHSTSDNEKTAPFIENDSGSCVTEVTTNTLPIEINTITTANKQIKSVKNCTLLKKLLEANERYNEKCESQGIPNNSAKFVISKEAVQSDPVDSGISSVEIVNDIDYKDNLNNSNLGPEILKEVGTRETRSIQEICTEVNESVTKPLEINVSEKYTNQSSGQDSPRIILKINKTDHGPSAKIITEDIKSDNVQTGCVTDVSQKNNDKHSPRRNLINSKRKEGDASPSATLGKRLRSSRLVDNAEISGSVKRIIGKRPSTETMSVHNKEPEMSILETKRLKLGQLLSNTSLAIKPVLTKTSPDNKTIENKQCTKILNHTLVNNENCSKNGNSKLHSIFSNLQGKQIQVLPLNDINCTDKSKPITPEVECNTSTGSSDVIENCHLDVQEMIINENSDFRDFSIGADEAAQDPLEMSTPKIDSDSHGDKTSIPKFIESTPQPKKRGRPRKLPVCEGAKPVALPTPALEERPQRSLRLSRDRPAILVKPRGGRGRGRGRGRGGLMATPIDQRSDETVREETDTPTSTSDPLDMSKPETPVDPTSSRIKLPRMTEALDRLPGGSTPLSSRGAEPDIQPPGTPQDDNRVKSWRGRGRGRTPAKSPRSRGRGRGGGRGAMYMKETLGIYGRVCGPATTTVQLFEEETCMMDDNATPAKPTHLLDEDSQSSVKSSTNESSKMKKSKFADLFDSNKVWTAADVREYIWPQTETPGEQSQVMMIQEQVAMFLSVKSFKRRYPELKRRVIAGEEREYVLQRGLVSEALCDLGVTAVDASEVLDIMLSDYPHKYEEFRAHQRQQQLAAAAAAAAADDEEEKVEVKAEPKPVEQKPEPPKVDPEKTRADLAAAAAASACEWNARLNALRRPACADLQTLAVHTRVRPPPAPATHLRPPAGFYPHALLPGQYQHAYRHYTPEQLRYFPLNTVMAAPPVPPDPESSSDSGADSDRSRSSDDSDRVPAKRKRLTKVKRNSHTDSRDKERDREESRDGGGEADTCRVCKLRLEANRKYTHERFIVCSQCNSKVQSTPGAPSWARTQSASAASTRGSAPTARCAAAAAGRTASCAADCATAATTPPAPGWTPRPQVAGTAARAPSAGRAARVRRAATGTTRRGAARTDTRSTRTRCARPAPECVRQTVSSLNVLDYTCGECRRGGITSRAAAVRLAPRTIATLFMAKRRFNKYAHRQYMQSRLQRKPDAADAPDAPDADAADAHDAPDDGSDAD